MMIFSNRFGILSSMRETMLLTYGMELLDYIACSLFHHLLHCSSTTMKDVLICILQLTESEIRFSFTRSSQFASDERAYSRTLEQWRVASWVYFSELCARIGVSLVRRYPWSASALVACIPNDDVSYQDAR